MTMSNKESYGDRDLNKYRIIEKIKYAIFLMSCFLLLFEIGKLEISASEDVDKDAECSLVINIPHAYRSELEDNSIPVRIYRIAEMTETGVYKEIEECESLNLDQLSFDATAKDLEEKASLAVELLKIDVGDGDKIIKPYREFDIVNNKGSVTGLETGLYLLYMDDYLSGKNKYSALPYIIFLPGTVEWQNSEGNTVKEWNYDLVVELKLSSSENIRDHIEIETHPEGSGNVYTGDRTNVNQLYTVAIFFGLLFMIVFLSKRQNRKTE